MNAIRPPEPNSAFAALRRLTRQRAPIEKCELCATALAAAHQHLIEIAGRRLVCACQACAILFSNQSSEGGARYRRIPDRVLELSDFQLADEQWERLSIPINLAFFFYNSATGKTVALYPSPAGPMESLLTLEAWEEIVQQNPVLRRMEPDVEALLVKRIDWTQDQNQYYIIPIDECYKLVGIIRSQWRGLSGGSEVLKEISRFFIDLRRRAERAGETINA